MQQVHHWHVTLTLAGEPVELRLAQAAMERLVAQRPFLESVTCSESTAELRFWDQGDSMLDVASLAMRLWGEHRESALLPRWQVIGLEVLRKDVRQARHDIDPRGQATRPVVGRHPC